VPAAASVTLKNSEQVRAVRKLQLLDASAKVVAEVRSRRCSIGHQDANDIVLADPTVSRFHCEIVLDEDGAHVRDLESRNGTFVDGTRVREAWLRDGAELRLGRTTLRARLDDERVGEPVSSRSELGSLLGQSMSMRAAFSLIEKAAATDATVLIEGETGTGKEGAAEAIHQLSPRRDRPLVVVDCASIPAGLLESELFGHDKGAFTGAISSRTGALAEADGGTVFLDEIGELPLDLQPKLLRFLERREIRRVGRSQMERVDVRVVAATHRDLRAAVNRQLYRADLYFRLSVVRITLPPLRERVEDVPLLSRELLRRMGASAAAADALLKPEFLRELQLHAWPGNVRELRNYLERCLIFQQPMPLEGEERPAAASFSQSRQRAIDSFERQYLLQLVEAHGGKVAEAAHEAGVGRAHLYRLLHKHGLTPRG
jgi:two-component system, NtrC family, response regulator GlrR